MKGGWDFAQDFVFLGISRVFFKSMLFLSSVFVVLFHLFCFFSAGDCSFFSLSF